MDPRRTPTWRTSRRAFSLVELAVVLIVVAVIAAIAIPTFQATIQASDESAAEAEVATGLRNAVAIARARGELGAPSPQVVAEAFAEMSAHAPGVSAVTVGAWTVCDVDAVGYNDCVDNATGTLIRYQVAGGVVGIVVEGTYTVLARVEANEVVSWVDADGTTTDALDGPGGPSVPQVPVAPVLVFFGGAGGSGTLDDVAVTSGLGETGDNLWLSDSFASDGAVTTGTPVEYLISDSAPNTPNTHPITSGFGVPANVWVDVSAFGDPGASTPVVSGGELVGGTASTFSQLAYDFNAGNLEASFEVTASTLTGDDNVGSQLADFGGPGGAFRQLASVLVGDEGARLYVAGVQVVGDGPIPVSAGDRVGLRRVGDEFQLRINGITVRSSVGTGPVTVSGTVAKNFANGAYDYTACFAELHLPGSDLASSTWLSSQNLGADGSFSVTGPGGSTINVRIYCPDTGPGGQSTAYWYGGGSDASSTAATEISLVEGSPVTLGTLDVRT